MIRSVYHFHIYYHVRRILKKIQVSLPHETSFNVADNPYTESEFLKICEDFRVPNDRYQDKNPPDINPRTKTPWTKTPLAKNPPDKNPPEKTYEHKIYFT